MHGHHDGLRGGCKVTNELLLLLLIGAKWEDRFKHAEIMARMKLRRGQGSDSTMAHPMRATVLT